MKRIFVAVTAIALMIVMASASAFAMNAYSRIGPSLASTPTGYDGKEFLYFKGHNNYHIWEGEYTPGSGWDGRGRVNDGRDPVSWAFTNSEPTSFTYTLPAITRGLAPRMEATRTYLIFKGHNNEHVWYTRREIYRDYWDDIYMLNWETPRYIPGTSAQYGPGAIMHVWGRDSDPVLTIAYTDLSNRIRLKRAYESTRPLRHSTPFEWRDIPAIPAEYKSGSGITLASFDGRLYVFFRGHISGYDDSVWHRPIPDCQLYYAVSSSNNPSDPDWEVHRVPSAYSMFCPTADVHTLLGDTRESLIIAFRGHNNEYIWLRKFDGEGWQNLGWVEGLCTSQRPAILSSCSYSMTLAFIPAGGGSAPKVAVGHLYINSSHSGDYADHEWIQTQGDDSCLCEADLAPAAPDTQKARITEDMLSAARGMGKQGAPEGTKVFANFPNPFNPETWIPYQLAKDADTTVRIYNSAGMLIRTLDLGHKSPGFYTTRDKAAYWDGRNQAGEEVSSGIYFYNVQAGGFSTTKKMIVAK